MFQESNKLSDVPLCIYHGNCSDGMGAAWVVKEAYRQHYGIMPEFFEGHYGKPHPDVTDKTVIIVDFSYPKEVLLEMEKVAKHILILDHHKTAEKDLSDYPVSDKVSIIFDMERSGAMMAWDHYFKDQDPPYLLTRIQDRDLWKFDYPDTNEIMAAVFSYPMDFAIWDVLIARSPKSMADEGKALLRNQKKTVDVIINQLSHETIILGYRVPAANCLPMFASDVGHILAKGRPFAAMWWEDGKKRHYSLRSNDEGIDASAIAKYFGGGGHRNACGFIVDIGSPEYISLTTPSV